MKPILHWLYIHDTCSDFCFRTSGGGTRSCPSTRTPTRPPDTHLPLRWRSQRSPSLRHLTQTIRMLMNCPPLRSSSMNSSNRQSSSLWTPPPSPISNKASTPRNMLIQSLLNLPSRPCHWHQLRRLHRQSTRFTFKHLLCLSLLLRVTGITAANLRLVMILTLTAPPKSIPLPHPVILIILTTPLKSVLPRCPPRAHLPTVTAPLRSFLHPSHLPLSYLHV